MPQKEIWLLVADDGTVVVRDDRDIYDPWLMDLKDIQSYEGVAAFSADTKEEASQLLKNVIMRSGSKLTKNNVSVRRSDWRDIVPAAVQPPLSGSVLVADKGDA